MLSSIWQLQVVKDLLHLYKYLCTDKLRCKVNIERKFKDNKIHFTVHRYSKFNLRNLLRRDNQVYVTHTYTHTHIMMTHVHAYTHCDTCTRIHTRAHTLVV